MRVMSSLRCFILGFGSRMIIRISHVLGRLFILRSLRNLGRYDRAIEGNLPGRMRFIISVLKYTPIVISSSLPYSIAVL